MKDNASYFFQPQTFSVGNKVLLSGCECNSLSAQTVTIKDPSDNSILKILVPFVTSQRNCFQSDSFGNAY